MIVFVFELGKQERKQLVNPFIIQPSRKISEEFLQLIDLPITIS